jgi:peptidyl-prolyl cis-trans isomerase C
MPPAIYGEIIPELEDVVFKMKVGEIAGPIKSKFGYHVIKKESEHKVDLSETHDRISKIMEKQKLDHYLQSIQEKFPVEVVDEQFK